MRRYSPTALVSALVTLSLILSAGAVRATDVHISAQEGISSGGFEVMAEFVAGRNARLEVDLRAEIAPGSSADVDFLLLDAQNYYLYLRNETFNVVPGSELDTDHLQLNTSLTSGVHYYLVADNTDRPSGGAFPLTQVECSASGLAVNCKEFTKTNPDDCLILGLGIVALVLSLIAMIGLMWRYP